MRGTFDRLRSLGVSLENGRVCIPVGLEYKRVDREYPRMSVYDWKVHVMNCVDRQVSRVTITYAVV